MILDCISFKPNMYLGTRFSLKFISIILGYILKTVSGHTCLTMDFSYYKALKVMCTIWIVELWRLLTWNQS